MLYVYIYILVLYYLKSPGRYARVCMYIYTCTCIVYMHMNIYVHVLYTFSETSMSSPLKVLKTLLYTRLISENLQQVLKEELRSGKLKNGNLMVYMYTCTCIVPCIYTCIVRIYMYHTTHTCVYMYTYIHIHTHTLCRGPFSIFTYGIHTGQQEGRGWGISSGSGAAEVPVIDEFCW